MNQLVAIYVAILRIHLARLCYRIGLFFADLGKRIRP
jgi:hypothetical protein